MDRHPLAGDEGDWPGEDTGAKGTPGGVVPTPPGTYGLPLGIPGKNHGT